MKNAIEIKNLTKEYNHFKLGEINLNIPSGCIIGLIGENGAGKTTFIKAILNIIKPTSGSIKIFEQELLSHEKEIKEEIGVALDDMFFPEILTPKNINACMKDIYKNWDSSLYQRYLRNFGLNENKKIKEMSKGMRKKLEIATALAHHPKLLILDEPTSGLDPVIRSEVLEIFQSFLSDEEHTILFSTHITTDLEHIADQIIFMDKGEILLNENRDELLEQYGILKCGMEDFPKIDKKDKVKYRKLKYNYEILIKDRDRLSKKYKDCVVDKITLEDLMVLMIKGANE